MERLTEVNTHEEGQPGDIPCQRKCSGTFQKVGLGTDGISCIKVSRKLPALELTKQPHPDAMDPPGGSSWECREIPGASWTLSSGVGMVAFYPAA